jgi:hypothetical protein
MLCRRLLFGSKLAAADEFDGVIEKGQPHSLFGQCFPCPAGMIGVVQVGLRMGHQAEDPSRFVADPGNGVHGAVWIVRVIHLRRPAILIAVLNDHMLICVESFQGGPVFGDELAFAVTDRQIKRLDASRENTWRGGVGLQIDPAIFKTAGIVEGKRCGLPEVITVEARQRSEFDQKLKAVADAQNQLPGPDEAAELVVQGFLYRRLIRPNGGMQYPVGAGFGRSEVVPVEKAARQIQELIIFEFFFPVEQLADVDDIHLVRAGQPAGMGRLHFAVRAVSRDNNGFDFSRHVRIP